MTDQSASIYTHTHTPCGVKLYRAGNSLPFGILEVGLRSSLKKGCAHASIGVRRLGGVYSSSLLMISIASGGVRGLKT